MNTHEAAVVIVEDDPENRITLEAIFKLEGYRAVVFDQAEGVLPWLSQNDVAVVLTDLKLKRMDGVELLKSIKRLNPSIEVILMTAFGTVEVAVEAMKEGAYDFVTKPFRKHHILKVVKNAVEKQALLQENLKLKQTIQNLETTSEIITANSKMRSLVETIKQVAPTTSTILILGESGTGKEIVARTIHKLSERSANAFVPFNCAAIPEALLESDLFGYEKGAFTGAAMRKPGRFEKADHGTLFMDEIGELPLATQAKLLRVLQDGTFERLGSNDPIRVDVRILAATNRNLEEAVKQNLFRKDLYYRLNVISLTIPPLRERKDDVDLLAHHFLDKYCRKNAKQLRGFEPETLACLRGYHFPGNVRELENIIERAVVLTKTEWITKTDLPETVSKESLPSDTIQIPIGTPLKDLEKEVIRRTLALTNGNKTLAAKWLGTSTRTIYRKLEEDANLPDDETESDSTTES